jgi:lysophospholipase L1-like esterase
MKKNLFEKPSMRLALVICAVLFIPGGYAIYSEISSRESQALYLQNQNYQLQVGLYDLYKTSRADVVMLGNSLTYGVNWNELLGRSNIVNRGIISDVTEGYLERLEYLYRLQPKLCFVEGGVNDLYANVDPKTVLHNYTRIVEELSSHGIIPVIQSTLFVGARWHDAAKKNREIAQLDAELKDYAVKKGITFLDLNAHVSSEGLLRDELTYDGLHLNAKGYALWGAEVDTVLQRHGL